jgi:hypothetical protein
MANTILLKGDPIVKEGLASEIIKPGHLLEYGGSDDVQKHADADEPAQPMIALERAFTGDGITDDYASGDTVRFAVMRPGDEFQGWLKDGQNVTAKGTKLVSNGDGTLKIYSAQTDSGDGSAEIESHIIVGQAMETKNASGSDELIHVEAM